MDANKSELRKEGLSISEACAFAGIGRTEIYQAIADGSLKARKCGKRTLITFTPNFPHMLDEQARHVADLVKTASEQQAQMVEPTREAESGWLETIRATAIDNLAFRQA